MRKGNVCTAKSTKFSKRELITKRAKLRGDKRCLFRCQLSRKLNNKNDDGN